MAKHAIIIGAGIAGAAAALALTKHNGLTCSIYEIRSEPGTIGGAVNLTPNALRYLDYLGVLPRLKSQGCEVSRIDMMSLRTGKRLGILNFDNPEKFKQRALRVMRHQLLQAMLDTLKEIGVDVQYNMKIESIIEEDEKLTATFEDGSTIVGDFLLGCDGIHSAVRTKFIDPDRKPEYTGVSGAYCLLDATSLKSKIPIEATSLYTGRHGSLLLSYTNANKTQLYMAAVMAAEDVGSREGWTVKGRDQEEMKTDFLRRFSAPTTPYLEQVLGQADFLALYPIFRLSETGKWTSGLSLLLGDAAHAMPPQGESIGLAIEDAVLLSQILLEHKERLIKDNFRLYDDKRRLRIDNAVKAANFGFETIKVRGWFTTIVIEWVTWIYLLLMASRKEKEYAYDVRELDLSA